MKEFVFLFRYSGNLRETLPEDEFKALEKKWYDWIGSIAAQGKLASNGMRLENEGKVLKSGGVVTDGPFVEIRERLGGFIVVNADTIDEAVTLAHGCPAVDIGGNVEVRPVFVKTE